MKKKDQALLVYWCGVTGFVSGFILSWLIALGIVGGWIGVVVAFLFFATGFAATILHLLWF